MTKRTDELLSAHGRSADFGRVVDAAYRPIASRIVALHAELGRPAVVGVCGAQGGGKSTLAEFVSVLLEEGGLSAAVLSLDDLYLTHAERVRLARAVHPLLATRGVPGTHDVELGVEVIGALTRPGPSRPVALPRFDKAMDDRAPASAWPVVTAPVDVVIFEGWCVGARPQALAELEAPLNGLEREQDPDGRWRAYANARLADDYPSLFEPIDLLILLQAPGFDQVFAWRAQQEHELAARLEAAGETGRAVMDDEALARFVMHYERLTRHILREMPGRADVVVRLGPAHEVEAVAFA